MQRNRNPGMPQPHQQPIKTGGTLVSVGQNQIQISTNTNQKMFVMVTPETEITVTGTAEVDYLKSGVNVEFVAEVDKTHKVKDKIPKMLIVAPTAERPAGLFAPEFATPDKKSEKGAKGDEEKVKPLPPDPGIGGAPPAKGRKGGGKKDADAFGDLSAGKPSKTRTSAPQFPGTFTVRGTVKSCKDGSIKVSAGRTIIQGEVDGSTTIDVETSDLHVAQPDDRVTVNGLSTARQDVVMAKSITIELANPLSGAKKHATHTKTPAAHAPKAKKAAGGADDLLGK